MNATIEARWIRSHVERLLQDEWDVCRVQADDDGDYGFRSGTAACWVRVMDVDPVMVRVFAHAAYGVKPSLKLFRELNEIQTRAMTAAIALQGDLVVVAQTLSPIDLTRPVLAQAIESVGGVAGDIGLLIALSFGGSTPYEPEAASTEEVA